MKKESREMETEIKGTRAFILVEWWDERFGAEVYGTVVSILRAAGATDITVPHENNLRYQPTNDSTPFAWGVCEGEMSFSFVHGLSWERGETVPVVKAIREVARLKELLWDADSEWDWSED
jgi:hypothetical protein